jgi:hypothetical protein
MRLLKGFVIAVCGLFIVVTLMSLLMPSKVMTSRSVSIHSSPQKIIDQVQDLNNWKNWHPVFKNEKNIVISTPSSGVNAYAEWTTGNKKNHLQITGISQAAVRFVLQRPGENEILHKIELTNFRDSNSVQVDWSALTKLKWYPWEKFSGIFVEKMTGPGYEAALNELKTFLESN